MSPGDCAFCEIVSGDRAAHVVFEDALSVGFLDHRPLFPGHVLIVPREHFETLPELPADRVGPFFANVQRLARTLPRALDAQGTLVAINNSVSQSVPHLHVHVVPRSKGDGLRGFLWPRRRYRGPEHMQDVCDRIRAALRD